MNKTFKTLITGFWRNLKTRFMPLALLALFSAPSFCLAQGTAFTYQGRLNDGLNPADGIYDLRFAIYDASSGGVQQGNIITNSATAVSNGLFTVTLDFGNQFPGVARWLDISVRTNGAGAFAALTPRQALTSTPYSIQAANAASAVVANSVAAGNITGTLNVAQLPSSVVTNGGSGVTVSGTFSGNGGGLTNLSAAQLTSIGNTNGGGGNFFVGLSGNATTTGSDNTANGVIALNNNTSGSYNTANGVQALYFNATGSYNTADGFSALFYNTSGFANTANGWQTLLSNTSGSFNTADGVTALGSNTNGSYNTANGYQALFLNTSGYQNTADGFSALVNNTSGSYNTADGVGALYSNMSGSNNIALGFVAGYNITAGSSNIDIGNQGFSTDTNIIRIGSGQAQTFIAGVINGDGGGLFNLTVSASQLTTIGNDNGGSGNFFVGFSGNDITSGSFNTGSGALALGSNLGGSANTANGWSALGNNISGFDNTAIGVQALYNNASGNFNTADGFHALLSNLNGIGNMAGGYVTLGNNTSGSFNTAYGIQALVGNTTGSNNIALGNQAGGFITTGSSNIDIGNLGGSADANIIRIGSSQTQTFIAGVINGNGGGLTGLNASQLTSGTVPDARLSANVPLLSGGNVALRNGGNTFTGNQIVTNGTTYNYSGTVVRPANPGWAAATEFDGTNDTTGCRAIVGVDGVGLTGVADQMFIGTYSSHPVKFFIGATERMALATNGNLGIGISAPTNKLHVIGGATFSSGTAGANQNVVWVPGSASWSFTSDRATKDRVAPVDGQSVLEKLVRIPINEWSYIGYGQRHIGPMAQDFHAQFPLNENDKALNDADLHGVALAAIQGLNEKIEVRSETLEVRSEKADERMQKLETENAELKARLDKFERLLEQKSHEDTH